jgi:cephalosporin-C deacetylase-like acetyl esterase
MATGSHPIPADMAVAAKFSAFNVVDVNYKEVNGVGIPASILVPKEARTGVHPVLVRWHGGCFITGHRMFPDWVSRIGHHSKKFC